MVLPGTGKDLKILYYTERKFETGHSKIQDKITDCLFSTIGQLCTICMLLLKRRASVSLQIAA